METKSNTPTGQELADNLNTAIEPLAKVAYWEHTGGGCAAIVIGNYEGAWRDDQGRGQHRLYQDASFLMVTPAEDIFTMADQHRPLGDEWGEGWTEFFIGHYAYDPADEDWWCEDAHHIFINGLESLAAAVAEWCQTGAISGWQVWS